MGRFCLLTLTISALIPTYAAAQVCAKQIDVPKYAPIALAARVSGVVHLVIVVGSEGKVVSVEGSGASQMLVDSAKENVSKWIFCDPEERGTTHLQLQYIYRFSGTPAYPAPAAVVAIDLGSGRILITSHPPEPQP
jgi:hypothetical protein